MDVSTLRELLNFPKVKINNHELNAYINRLEDYVLSIIRDQQECLDEVDTFDQEDDEYTYDPDDEDDNT